MILYEPPGRKPCCQWVRWGQIIPKISLLTCLSKILDRTSRSESACFTFLITFFFCFSLLGASRVVQSSGESSLSSGSVTSIPQVVNQSITHSGEFGSQKSNDCHTNTRSHEIDTHAYKDLDERFTKQVNILNTSSGTCTLQEENKLNQQNLKVETLDTGGCIARSVSEKSEQKVPIHSLLTQQEISILMSKCKKPIRTASSIAFEEFNILITDVIDSCHFWANIDDKVRGQKTCFLFYYVYNNNNNNL